MKDTTAQTLATLHPQSAGIHWDIKALITETDAQQLISAGFSDCSYGNDEVPSYYIDGVEDLHLMACDEIDDNGQRISDQITYLLLFNSRPCADEYLSIDDAINAYIELAATIDSQ